MYYDFESNVMSLIVRCVPQQPLHLTPNLLIFLPTEREMLLVTIISPACAVLVRRRLPLVQWGSFNCSFQLFICIRRN